MRGRVDDAGGGIITIVVGRDTTEYPRPGDTVVAVIGEMRLSAEEDESIGPVDLD